VKVSFERRNKMRLRIEANTNDLEALKRIIGEEPTVDLEVQEITRMEPGALNEPILTGVVLVGLAKTAAKMINRWMEHKEKLQDAENVRLHELIDGRSKGLSMKDLETLARASG
jgi:hypothetical protein